MKKEQVQYSVFIRGMDKHPKGFFVRHFGLRGVALFEAGKGGLALLAAAWVLTLRHKDMKEVAESLLQALHKVLHINPDRRLFQWIQHSVGGLTHSGLHVITAVILFYAGIRFVEAAGLWLEKEWAEWFALITGAAYVPLEVYELARRPSMFKWGVLAINLVIVLYLAWLLRDSYQRRHRREAAFTEQSAGLDPKRPQAMPTTED
jgi:uncharacterized membrane protein (DUF2068 family)